MVLACGSKVGSHSLWPVFRPAGRKTGHKKDGIYLSAEGQKTPTA
jgi:hypothetical protein